MNRIDFMLDWCKSIIDAKYGYSQDWDLRWGHVERDGKRYFDCSAYALTALSQVGINIGSCSYTGNMYQLKNNPDLEYLKFDRKSLQRGDVIYYHKSGNIGHVAIYVGNDRMYEAKGKAWGVVESPYRDCGWQYIIRMKDNFVVAKRVEFVAKLYEVIMNREANDNEIEYWLNELKADLTVSNMVQFFFDSTEFKARWIDDDEYIKMVYLVLFNREAESEAVNYWCGELKHNSRLQVLGTIMLSDEWNIRERSI